ncbi:unnamed protein product [Durusdinium trenchii]|uniref:Uncharacterized protein n=1 Tax=Durusdinium trenchii TaxID=1381693 RepID=A0ABP0LAF5_9DINO
MLPEKYVRLEKDEVCHTGAPNLEIASAKALLPSSSFGSQRSSSSARTIASEGGGLSTWGRRNLEGEVRQLRWELNEERLLAGRLRQELQKAQQQLRQAHQELDLQRDRDALLGFAHESPRGGHVCRSFCALFGRR